MISLNSSKLSPLTSTRLVFLVSAFLVLTGNWAFYAKLTEIYPLREGHDIFILSISIFHYCFLLLLTVTFWLFIPVRVVLSLFVLLAALVGYYSDQLGVVIDTVMISNILESNLDEASDLMSIGFIGRFMAFGVVPLALIWSMPIRKSGVLRELRYKLQTAAIASVGLILCVTTMGDHYASFFREHKSIRYYLNPSFAIYSVGKYIKKNLVASTTHSFTRLAKRSERNASDIERELVVLVVGETARADHFSLNGYLRETNPLLSERTRLISYSDISACGTSTAVSVPCMFANKGRKKFDLELSRYTENILDLLKRAGVNILWRDNNSSSKGVANRVDYQSFKSPAINPVCDTECRDVGMLDGLQEYVDSHHGDILIVLHQMGSHGPAYFKRYPKQFEKFKPACKSIELSQCTREEIINAYDNTILYTDHFLEQVISFLEKNTTHYETSMFYVSDHGESLGENGLYLHGLPYMLAPPGQKKVPLVVWSGVSSDIDFERTLELKDTPNSHDALFNALLNLFEVEIDIPRPIDNSLIYVKEEINKS